MSPLRLLPAALAAGGLFALAWMNADRSAAVQAAPLRLSEAAAFKITFGLKNRFPNISWNGGFRDPSQIRGVQGWHLDTTDKLIPPSQWEITLRPAGRDVTPKGVIVDLASPEEQPVTFFTRNGDFTFVPSSIRFGEPLYVPGLNNDVSVERVPRAARVSTEKFEDDAPAVLQARDGTLWTAWVAYRTVEREGFYIQGGDQVMVARSQDGVSWSEPAPLTPPGDHFRVALGEDGSGNIWCVYGLQKEMETGNFDLFAKHFNGRTWSGEEQITSSPLPDIFHRMAQDPNGNLYLVWMGYRALRPGAAPQSDILLRVRTANGWSAETPVTESDEDDWEPAVAVTREGQAWITWDSYRAAPGRTASYDVLARSYQAGRMDAVRTVSATQFAEMRSDVSVDGAGRVWISWEEGGVHWGKDTGYENPKHRIYLRKGGSLLYGPNNSLKALYRRPRVAVLENRVQREPQAQIEQAYPEFLQANLFQNPRLGVDGSGKVWLFLRHQQVARGRFAGHLFDFYATTLTGEGSAQRWLEPVPLPGSTGRQDTVLAAAPAGNGTMLVGVVGDGRRLPVGLPENHEVSCMLLRAPPAAGEPALAEFQPSADPGAPPPHPAEAAEVDRIRKHRTAAGGRTYRIVRGDLHRHTQISMDGAIDGSLWDLYRYAMNAAAFDYIAVTDHNYGAWLDTDEPESRNTDDIYQWWRTQKSCDLFHVPGRFVPLYGYERSINFPLGHRNIIHTRRGVFALRVPKLHISERSELIAKDAQGLWSYLRATGGIGIPHTSGTVMGTDWKYRDDAVEPVTEIYQGDRNSYEEEGAPRAAIPESIGDGGGGRAPFQKGLIWNALGVGYKMGFIASSDHFSTHISYANILVPQDSVTRESIQEALRMRRTYASTDNIIVDFSAGEAMQGEELRTDTSPLFRVAVAGTAPLLRVEVIKNNRVIYSRKGDGPDASKMNFTFRDSAEFGGDFADTSMGTTSQIKDWTRPETGIRARPKLPESYYYVRVIQSFGPTRPELDGEIAWSSPIFIRHQK